MDLTKIETYDLEKELVRRQDEKEAEEAHKLPENPLQYKEVKTLILENNKENIYSQYFVAHIYDGCEGFQYLIQYDHPVFDSIDDDDEYLNDTVKHALLTRAKKEGWLDDFHLENIELQEFGRETLTMLKIDGTNHPDNYNEDEK